MLTSRHHIHHIQTSCQRQIEVLKRIAHFGWGADRATLKKYFEATIVSKLAYGSSVYGSASPSVLKPLTTIYNAGLRLSLGAFRSSPATSLYAEAEALPLHKRRKLWDVKLLHKLSASVPGHPFLEKLTSKITAQPQQINYHRNHSPLFIRALEVNNSLSLPQPYIHPKPPYSPISRMDDLPDLLPDFPFSPKLTYIPSSLPTGHSKSSD